MRFDKIVVIGSGKVAVECVKYLTALEKKIELVVCESERNRVSMLERQCNKHAIKYQFCDKKNDIENFLLINIKGQRSLIISANNTYIFTKKVINEPGVEIINFHYSLLPKYRGLNIPTWVIYNNEKETGITWHYVTEQIDAGAIIAQKKIEITNTTTAFDIIREGMNLAIASFNEFIKVLLERRLEGRVFSKTENSCIYKKATLPLGGKLNLDQSIELEDIAKVLRSFDDGGTGVIDKLQIIYKEKARTVQEYFIEWNELQIRQITICCEEEELILSGGDTYRVFCANSEMSILCAKLFYETEFAPIYYPQFEMLYEVVKNGVDAREVYVVVDEKDKLCGGI